MPTLPRLTLLLAFSMAALAANAQRFEWIATITPPQTTGFQNIYLPPEVTSRLNHNYADIRLFDQDGKEVPYLQRIDRRAVMGDESLEMAIDENKHQRRKGHTRLRLANPQKKELDNIFLLIEPTDHEVWIKMSGSQDGKNWFILKESSPYFPELDDDGLMRLSLLDFPKNDYPFVELLLYDYNNKPVVVEKALNYELGPTRYNYSEIKPLDFTQNDTIEEGYSLITIKFDQEHYIDRISFQFEGPVFYMRRAELSKLDTLSEKKMKVEFFDQAKRQFYVSSNGGNILYLSDYKAQTFYLRVKNDDSPPLRMVSANAYQLNKYLTAYLEAGKRYELRFGNERLSPPLYDLKYFRDSIPDTIPTVHIHGLPSPAQAEQEAKMLEVPTALLWSMVGLVTLLLAFLSVRMFREIIP